jgi:hypothetical protein
MHLGRRILEDEGLKRNRRRFPVCFNNRRKKAILITSVYVDPIIGPFHYCDTHLLLQQHLPDASIVTRARHLGLLQGLHPDLIPIRKLLNEA